MQPTEILRQEHRIIEGMLALLQRAAAGLERGEEVDRALFEQAIDFIRNFADRYHHAKEEGAFFTTLEAHGFPRRGGPIGVMLSEHDEGRAHVRGMAEALARHPDDPTARVSLMVHARGYADLLSAHIYKEDNILYPMGDQMLPPSAQADLLRQFEELERGVLTAAERQRYLAMVQAMSNE